LWKILLRILYKMTARTRRFCFFLLQLPSNVTLVILVDYLFCLIVYYTNCTTCNMLKYRLQQYHNRHCLAQKFTACSKEPNMITVHILKLHQFTLSVHTSSHSQFTPVHTLSSHQFTLSVHTSSHSQFTPCSQLALQSWHKKTHTKYFNMKDNTVAINVSVHKLFLLLLV
jgi:hypothetical protein